MARQEISSPADKTEFFVGVIVFPAVTHVRLYNPVTEICEWSEEAREGLCQNGEGQLVS